MTDVIHPQRDRPFSNYDWHPLSETTDHVASDAGAAVSLAYAAPLGGLSHCLDGLVVSFSAAPAAAVKVTVSVGPVGSVVEHLVAYVPGAIGPHEISLHRRFPDSTRVLVEVAAAGGSVVTHLYTTGHHLSQVEPIS